MNVQLPKNVAHPYKSGRQIEMPFNTQNALDQNSLFTLSPTLSLLGFRGSHVNLSKTRHYLKRDKYTRQSSGRERQLYVTFSVTISSVKSLRSTTLDLELLLSLKPELSWAFNWHISSAMLYWVCVLWQTKYLLGKLSIFTYVTTKSSTIGHTSFSTDFTFLKVYACFPLWLFFLGFRNRYWGFVERISSFLN